MSTNLTQNIQSVSFTKPAVKAALRNVNVTLHPIEWATVFVEFIDEDDRTVAVKAVPMSLEESELWAGDDAYVLQLALAKLGAAFTIDNV